MKKIFTSLLALALILTLSACTQSAPESTAPTAAPQPTTPPETTAPPATTAPSGTTAPTATESTTAPSTVPETTAATTAPPQSTASPETTAPPANTATLIISCKIALESGLIDADKLEILPGDGIILHVKDAEIADGDTVFDLLQRECRANKVHMEFVKTPSLGSAYIEGIGNLYELDGGALSGWVFTVNGEWPGKGSSSLVVLPGDVIEWQFTCDLGRDVGAPDAALGGSY